MLDRNYIFIFSWTIIIKANGLHNTISSVLTISLLAALHKLLNTKLTSPY